MPRESVSNVLVIGSGAIKIAEAAEFDYSGSQALKALKEEGIRTVLVSPNVATIQTSHELADRVYLVPLTLKDVAKVIENERPDGIMIGFGGQTALSLGISLHDSGVLKKYGIKVLGTPIEGIRRALDRELFRETMIKHGLPVPPSKPVTTLEEALEAAEEIGYPVIVRVSFNLGGRGSFVAWTKEELKEKIHKAMAHSEIRKLLVEKYLHHWKEIEYEVMRDKIGQSVAVACLENVDPMGVHTGDSIVVAPCQTLTDREYQLLRRASMAVADSIELIGECNVQLALDPRSELFYIIETNPRMSRSSALASKATGYPLAYLAAKLALGYVLDELKNKVTGVTTALFEPSLDYVVVKIPRWDLEKFVGAEKTLSSEMMSVGEVMAIGRNLHEAFQKAVRMLDIRDELIGEYYEREEPLETVLERLKRREPYTIMHIAKALKLGASVDDIHKITGVDKYFIYVIEDITNVAEALKKNPSEELVKKAKKMGFSYEQIKRLTDKNYNYVRPKVKQIDTLAGEWPASTNYLYVTYDASENDVEPAPNPKILILGSGTFRIGVSVEFDWATVSFLKAAKRRGYNVIIINNNPETVSTDWDVSDRLYFEELTLERVLEIYELEKPDYVVTFAGGQIPNNLAKKLEERGVRLLGTSGKSIDIAEDRAKFSKLLDRLGIKQPAWIEAKSIEEVLRFADEVGYPVIVRPSYVIGGMAVKLARDKSDLESFLKMAKDVSREHPVVVSKYIEGIEIEVDAVSDSSRVVGVIAEHIEPAGVHSGDATHVTPLVRTPPKVAEKIKDIALTLALELKIKGPFNVQFVVDKKGDVHVIELNLRASRSMPFASKSRGLDFMELVAQATLDGRLQLGEPGTFFEIPAKAYAVKSPQFSWAQIRGTYPFLGPEMRSTGEVAALDPDYLLALAKSWLGAKPNRFPSRGALVYTYANGDDLLEKVARELESLDIRVYTIDDNKVRRGEPVSKEKAIRLLKEEAIDFVATSGYTPELDYYVRRLAVDLNVPLVLDPTLALELTKAMKKVKEVGDYEVKEMSEYWIFKAI
ncbi:MAG: carbamoyl-phosphate synthase (glutamine-hydrolyzing) large subunit [Acidilobaceae archaeon]